MTKILSSIFLLRGTAVRNETLMILICVWGKCQAHISKRIQPDPGPSYDSPRLLLRGDVWQVFPEL